jgi:uncharacterized protein (DUF3820 family)
MEHPLLEFIMTFGKHKGKEIGDVPCSYLVWLDEEGSAEGTLKEILEMYEEEISAVVYEADDAECTLRQVL